MSTNYFSDYLSEEGDEIPEMKGSDMEGPSLTNDPGVAERAKNSVQNVISALDSESKKVRDRVKILTEYIERLNAKEKACAEYKGSLIDLIEVQKKMRLAQTALVAATPDQLPEAVRKFKMKDGLYDEAVDIFVGSMEEYDYICNNVKHNTPDFVKPEPGRPSELTMDFMNIRYSTFYASLDDTKLQIASSERAQKWEESRVKKINEKNPTVMGRLEEIVKELNKIRSDEDVSADVHYHCGRLIYNVRELTKVYP